MVVDDALVGISLCTAESAFLHTIFAPDAPFFSAKATMPSLRAHAG